MNNGPEDLLLEELVRNWKWAAAQQHAANRQRQPQLADIRLADEDDYVEEDVKIQFEPKMDEHREQKNFAYRPHEDRFRNHRPLEPARQIKIADPLIQSAGRTLSFPYFSSCLNKRSRSAYKPITDIQIRVRH